MGQHTGSESWGCSVSGAWRRRISGEARGLTPPGEMPTTRDNGAYIDGFSHSKKVNLVALRLEEDRSNAFSTWRKSFIQAA